MSVRFGLVLASFTGSRHVRIGCPGIHHAAPKRHAFGDFLPTTSGVVNTCNPTYPGLLESYIAGLISTHEWQCLGARWQGYSSFYTYSVSLASGRRFMGKMERIFLRTSDHT